MFAQFPLPWYTTSLFCPFSFVIYCYILRMEALVHLLGNKRLHLLNFESCKGVSVTCCAMSDTILYFPVLHMAHFLKQIEHRCIVSLRVSARKFCNSKDDSSSGTGCSTFKKYNLFKSFQTNASNKYCFHSQVLLSNIQGGKPAAFAARVLKWLI